MQWWRCQIISSKIYCFNNSSAILKGKLDNCLEYYICKTPYNSGNNLYLLNKAGSRYEKDLEIGISHFLEHLCLGFAKKIPYNKLVSGATLYEHTRYKIQAERVDEIPKQLIMLKKILLGETIVPEQIEEIREDVIREWNIGCHSESYSMRKEVFDELFCYDLVSRLPIGDYKNISNINIEDLYAYHKKFYTTNSSAIICLGDIDLVDVEIQIKSIFGELKKSMAYNFKSYLTAIPRGPRCTMRFNVFSLKEVTGELYCLLFIDNEPYSLQKKFLTIITLFSLIEEDLKKQLLSYQIRLNQCSVYENRIIKEFNVISFDLPCSSEKTIKTQVISDCLYKVIGGIKEGRISERAFQQAKLAAVTEIKNKNSTVNLLDKCILDFMYHNVEFEIQNEIKKYQEYFDALLIGDVGEMCKIIFYAI